MTDPLHCPFCGNPATTRKMPALDANTSATFDATWARCPDPACAGYLGALVDDWNRRAPDPRLAEAVRVMRTDKSRADELRKLSRGDHSEDLDRACAFIRDLESQLATARGLITLDRTGLAAGLDNVRKIANGYSWLGPGDEWGCYTCDEQTEENLRAEMGRCLSEIIDMAVTALRASGVRADQAFNGPFDIVVEQSRIEALESQLAAKDRRIEELEAKASLKQCAKAAQSERDAERARADKAEADLRDTETLCSRLQARVHLLEQLNAELQASECGQLQERLTAALQDKDVVEAERDEARRELAMRMGRQMAPNGRSCNTSHDDIIPYARKEADREWGRGEGSRLFPEEVDDADQA